MTDFPILDVPKYDAYASRRIADSELAGFNVMLDTSLNTSKYRGPRLGSPRQPRTG
jgi:hypothetical protein